MILEKFDKLCARLSYQYIKLNADDMLEYLLLILAKEENIENINLDE